MRRTRAAALVAAFFAAALCVATTTARAQKDADAAPVEPIAIAYDAPSGCPDSTAFFREIASRTARARSARSGEKARVLHVAIVKGGGNTSANAFTGRLLIEEAATWSSAREVSGATCVEVVEALGLIGALAVDPKASTAPRASSSSASSTPATSSASTTATTTTSTATEPPAPPTPPTEQKDRRPDPPPDVSTPPSQGGRPRFGLGVQVDGVFLADLVASGRVFGDVELGARDGDRVFDPSVRVAISRSLDVERHPTIGGATIRWTLGSLEGCPLRLAIAKTIAARPCAGASFGVIDAEATGVNSARSRSRPWVSASAQARVMWEPTRALALELEAGGLMPFFRESFFFEPSVDIYQAPIFAFFGRVGASVRFP